MAILQTYKKRKLIILLGVINYSVNSSVFENSIQNEYCKRAMLECRLVVQDLSGKMLFNNHKMLLYTSWYLKEL